MGSLGAHDSSKFDFNPTCDTTAPALNQTASSSSIHQGGLPAELLFDLWPFPTFLMSIFPWHHGSDRRVKSGWVREPRDWSNPQAWWQGGVKPVSVYCGVEWWVTVGGWGGYGWSGVSAHIPSVADRSQKWCQAESIQDQRLEKIAAWHGKFESDLWGKVMNTLTKLPLPPNLDGLLNPGLPRSWVSPAKCH